MAYVDDLVIAGEDHAVQKFIQNIQETFSLKHAEYLTPDHPNQVLGSDHQGQNVRSNDDGVSSEAHRQFAESFQSHRKIDQIWSQDADDLERRSSQM